MNKKLLGISAAVIVVILLAGFTTFWFLGSSKLKRDLAEEIVKINEKTKVEGPGGLVTYESMSAGGFPFSIEVTLNKVQVKGAELDKGAFQLDMDQVVFSKSLFGSSEKIGGMNNIAISIPTHKGVKARKLVVNSPNGLWLTVSHFENASGLGYVFGQKQLPTTSEEWKQWGKNIKGAEYWVGKTTLTDADSGKVLWEGGSGEVKVTIETQADERRKYNVKIAAKDMEMKPEFQEWVKELAKEKKELPDTFTSFFSSNGKSSYDVAFSVTAPQSGFGAIDIDIQQLAYKAGETTTDAKGQVNVDIPRKSGSLKLSGDYKADAAYRATAKKNVESYAKLIIDMAKTTPNADMGARKKVALTSSLIRTFSELVDQPEGKMDFDISVPGLGATIKKAEYRAGSYGFSLNGEINMLNPTGSKIYARIYNGRALAAKFVREFEKVGQDELNFKTSPELLQRLNELLDMAVSTPDPKDLILSYSLAENKIGTLSLQEFNRQLEAIFDVEQSSNTALENDDGDHK